MKFTSFIALVAIGAIGLVGIDGYQAHARANADAVPVVAPKSRIGQRVGQGAGDARSYSRERQAHSLRRITVSTRVSPINNSHAVET